MSTIQYERALALLEAPEKYPGLAPRKGIALLRVWMYPSFRPCAAWSILESGKSFFVRRVVWDQVPTVDSQPITFGAESPVVEESFSGLLSELRTMQLSPFALASTIGIDGTSYGVEVGGFGKSGFMSWWGKPPVGWAPLEAWHARAIKQLESLLPSSTSELPTSE
ncbi:hypothetical protein M0765_013470 [Variovorax sp. S2]|uniref:hypothetical protein n=1 Tax=Variovorax sp. S12S4 TaxID=3029170 RepID=UPI00215BAA78|nr:hypothetical protein [Variovorax sp. S12S4]MCR8958699.1 hypothetical protein [Variovorax sp. S12S4]